MKTRLLLLSVALISLFACNNTSKQGSAGSGSTDLVAEIDSFSYCIGADIGKNVRQTGVTELNMAAFTDGFLSALAEDSIKVNEEETRKVIQLVIQKLYKEKCDKNKKEGEDFLAENKDKEGVKVTPSGIQYIILQEGNGPIPADSNTVKVNYKGTLIDGTEFDSSYERGEPAQFPVKGVIKGWQEILQMMPVGSKWKVFIPTELAYGENVRRGGKIEPNMALIFEMELLEIIDPAKLKMEREQMKKEQDEKRKKMEEERLKNESEKNK